MKIAINGLGRIGRSLSRLVVADTEFELRYLYDEATIEMSAYLLRYDSTHKTFDKHIDIQDQNMIIQDQKISYSSEFKNVDIVIECSGKFLNFNQQTIYSSMPKDNAMRVYLEKITDDNVLDDKKFSAGSCTSNAAAYILKAIDDKYVITSGSITTIHSYTNDQNLLDSKNNQISKSRSAPNNIIPTPTGVVKNLRFLLPHLQKKLLSFSLRVPVKNVTLLDFTLNLQKNVKISTLKQYLKDYFKTGFDEIVGIIEDEVVSSDMIGDKKVVNVNINTLDIKNNACKITAWIDNEMGYAYTIYRILKKIKKEKDEVKNNK